MMISRMRNFEIFRTLGLTVLAVLTLAACNPLGKGASSTVDAGHAPGALSPPTAFSGSIAAVPSGFTVTWAESHGANLYRVKYGTSSGSYPTSAGDTTALTLSVASLVNGQTYYVMVTAVSDTGETEMTSELVVRPISTFAVTAASKTGATAASVTWSAAVGADSYDILYGTSSSSLTSVQAGVSSPATLTGLTPSTVYYVRVRAKNAVGSGAEQVSNSVASIGGVAPTMSSIGAQSTSEDTATSAISFSVTDTDSPLACDSTWLSMSSDNTALIASADVTWGGTAPNCTAVLTPKADQNGSAQITFTVSDDSAPALTASRTFAFTVTAVNDAPVLSGLTNVTFNEDTTSSPMTFSLTDVDSTLSCTAALSGSSATTSVIANSGIAFGGTVPNCTLALTPVANAYGTSVITVTATDGALTTSATFTATVNQLGDDALTGLPWTFDNSTHYTVSSSTTVDVNSSSNGLARLIKADIIDNATTATGGDLDFSNYVSKSSNVTVGNGKVLLSVTSADDAVSTGATYSGELLSRVIDGRTTAVDWSSVLIKTPIPYGKELSMSTESGYTATVADLSPNLVANYRMNETAAGTAPGGKDIVDSKFGNDGTRTGSPAFGQTGLLNGAIDTLGTSYFTIPDSPNLDNTTAISISVWFNPSIIDTAPRGLVSKRVSNVSNVSYSLFMYTSSKIYFDVDDVTPRLGSTSTFSANRWYHVVATWDGSLSSGSRSKIYINGKLDATGPGPASIADKASDLYIGTLNANYGGYFNGKIDEVSIWRAALTDTQIAQLYRRGSLRAGVQVRTCDDASCATGSPAWVGGDGTSTRNFSEARNTSNGLPSGSVNPNVFSVAWSTLRTAYSAFNTWAANVPFGTIMNIRKRYLQYRLVLESWERTTSTLCTTSNGYSISGVRPCAAEVSTVEFANDRYDSTAPTVTTNSSGTDLGVEFYSLTGFNVTLGGASCTDARYQLALNGTSTWYYFNGTTWVEGTGYGTASTEAQINSNISTFPTVVGRGKLYVRTFLASSGSSACEIDSISVAGGK